MNLDRDLREALAPLAGDPASDAARVLAALPPAAVPPTPPAGRRGRPQPPAPRGWPLPWVALAVALASGLGALLGWAMAGRGEPPAAPPAQQPPAQQPPPEKEPPKETVVPMPTESRDMLMLMAFGPLEIDEPGVGEQDLRPGGYMTKLGTTVRTGEAFAGLYVYANDARVRLDRETVALVAEDRVVVTEGRVWLSTTTRPTPFAIDAGPAQIEGLGMEVQIERRADDVDVLCLGGDAQLRSGGTVVALSAMQRVRSGAGGVGEPESLGFAGTATAWMVPMIRQQQDDRELQERIGAMVKAFAAGTYRAEAAVELRRLGSRAVPVIYEAMLARPAPADEQRQAAELLGSLAEYSQAPWLLALLEHGEADVRAAAWRALARVAGQNVEDETFWRSAEPVERERALARWRALLR